MLFLLFNQAAPANLRLIPGLVTEGYLPEVPVSPTGATTWSAALTGYTLQRDTTGVITVRACESENTTEISASR